MPHGSPRCIAVAVAIAVVLTGFAPSAFATFEIGDLYLLSQSLPGQGGVPIRGIVHIDPTTGTSSLLYSPMNGILGTPLAYDSFRNLLVFFHSDSLLVGANSSGVLTQLAAPPGVPGALTSRGDGILYMQIGGDFYYIDAANAIHPLLDQTGTAMFSLGSAGVLADMRYDPGTNSLITFCAGGVIAVCPDATQVCAGKIPLTAAGTQVAGPMVGAQAEVSDSGEAVVGTGILPDGDVLFVVDTNINSEEWRIQAIDPATMVISSWAGTGMYSGAAAVSAGTFSTVRNQGVIDDSFNNMLRGFNEGSAGLGDEFSTSATGFGVSANMSHSEIARLVEITPAVPTGALEVPSPARLVLEAPHPNPFNPRTTIRFHLTRAAHARLEVFGVRGRLVRILADETRSAGWHTFTWDGTDDRGNGVASGVYFVRLNALGEAEQQRFVLIR